MRQPGYYWIKAAHYTKMEGANGFQVAYWTGFNWYVCGNKDAIEDSVVTVADDTRIPPPRRSA